MKLVCYGEMMLRLMPPGYTRVEQAAGFDVTCAGAEGNVAVDYARFGGTAAFVTALPDAAPGRIVVNAMRAQGVDMGGVLYTGPRVGVFYVERGAAQRPSTVVYDRAGSSFATAEPSAYDWDALLAGADWFFFTGITPALGEKPRAALRAAVAAAKRLGVRVACDLNFRRKLWSVETAAPVMRELVRSVDLLIANEEHAALLLGVHEEPVPRVAPTNLSEDLYSRRQICDCTARKISAIYGTPCVAMTLRTTLSSEETMTAAVFFDGRETHNSPDYRMVAVDRVGSGDAYAAGLLYGLSAGMSPADANRFGAAACALKHSINGDFCVATRAEVEAMMHPGDGRLIR